MFDVVLVTNGKRPELLKQTRESLFQNATASAVTQFVEVWDGCYPTISTTIPTIPSTVIIISPSSPRSASAARNIGASSIPKYRRGKYVMFIDEDVYMCRGWDEALEHVSGSLGPERSAIISGHAHPFNHTILRESRDYLRTNVISTVHMLMPWSLWDDVGYFIEPGGAAGSEDVDYCRRATEKGYPLVVTKPQICLHTGISNSSGKPIVGADQVRENNAKLERIHEIQGKVIYR